MSKTREERAQKYLNRTGIVVAVVDPELNYDPPTHVRRRWGWAIPWDQGICYRARSPYAWNKHLFTARGVCRRCGYERKEVRPRAHA